MPSERQLAKTIAKLKIGSKRGQSGTDPFMGGKKSNFGKWLNFGNE